MKSILSPSRSASTDGSSSSSVSFGRQPIAPSKTLPEGLPASALTIGSWWLWIVGSVMVASLVFVACLRFGSETITISQILSILANVLAGASSSASLGEDPSSVILLHVRLPRLLLAFFVGGSLSIVGAVLQALLRNPLADPFIIGISSGAALGAAMALLLGIGGAVGTVSALPVCAFLGALGSLILVYRLSSTGSGFSVPTLLLAGVVVNAIFSALILFLTSVADPNKTFGMYAWLMGTLTGPDYVTLTMIGVYLAVGIGLFIIKAQALNVLTLGEETARSLGVEVERLKKQIFFTAALVTGVVVAFSGLIGFVGLIVPHAVRLGVGADHRLLLPMSGLFGGVFLMVADTLARTVMSPIELPVGVLTALVGGPIFLYLLMQKKTGWVTR